MADAPVVHIGQNSPEFVARMMAQEILFHMENKRWEQVNRDEYLKTVAQCLRALGHSHGPI